jgi:hypothetical protein
MFKRSITDIASYRAARAAPRPGIEPIGRYIDIRTPDESAGKYVDGSSALPFEHDAYNGSDGQKQRESGSRGKTPPLLLLRTDGKGGAK